MNTCTHIMCNATCTKQNCDAKAWLACGMAPTWLLSDELCFVPLPVRVIERFFFVCLLSVCKKKLHLPVFAKQNATACLRKRAQRNQNELHVSDKKKQRKTSILLLLRFCVCCFKAGLKNKKWDSQHFTVMTTIIYKNQAITAKTQVDM